MPFHCDLILKISLEQSAENLIVAPLKFLWFLSLGYFKIFNLVSSSFIMLYLHVFFYINFAWGSLSFCISWLCGLLSFISLENLWSPFQILFLLLLSSWDFNYVYIRWNDSVHVSLILYCSLYSFFPLCFSLYIFPLNCPWVY